MNGKHTMPSRLIELEHELAFAIRSNDELKRKLAEVTERYNIDTWEMSLMSLRIHRLTNDGDAMVDESEFIGNHDKIETWNKAKDLK